MRFTNKVVLVAGGTGGLGRAVTLAFLNEDADVIVTWRNSRELEALKRDAGSKTPRLEDRQVDVTDDSAVERFVEEIRSRKGGLDIMVNTVGGFAGGTKLWESDAPTLDQMLALNLRAGFTLSRAAARVMLRAGEGTILNIAAKAALDHPPGIGAYAASKAAALALMDSLAADLNGTGIRVNSILPSIIDTEANRKAMPQADFARWPKPEDIARVILFLCSDDAKVIHGAAIPVYGNG